MKKHSFFGLKRQAVDAFLQKIKNRYVTEENERHDQLQQLQRENEKLELTIKQWKEKPSHSSKEQFISYAQERTPLIIAWLENQAEDELKKLNLEYEQEAAAINQQIQKLDKEIENGTSLLFSMVNQYASMIENIQGHIMIKTDKTNLYDSIVTYQIDPPFEDEEKAIGYSTYWEGAEKYLANTNRRNKEVTVPSFSIQDAEIDEVVDFNTYEDPLINSTINYNGEPLLEMVSKVEQGQKPRIIATEQLQEKSNEIKADAELKREALESQGVKQELDQIKKRYIVGKLSGLDLYGQKGQLIVGNNEVITNDMIELARQEGVLAELIVHMKIPGLGDS
jgi:cell division septum initiation protein DivIVA